MSPRPHGVTRRLGVLVALVVAPMLAALIVLWLLMYVTETGAALVAAVIALTAVLGVGLAWRAARTLAADERAVKERAEAARREMIAAASHDLRTPTTSLRLLLEAIDDDVVTGATRRDYLRRMRTHIEALSALIDDLFELSRLQAGDINWSLERVALGDLVEETVDALTADAAAHRVAVRADLPDGLAAARGNPEKLQRVLFNLIQNAIRHSPADGSVVVRAETAGDVIEVEVADDGTGIASADRERVFDAFYRGDAARSTDGAGLGLSVARAIVEAHGGRIWLPDAAHGTRVRFTLPVAA